MNRRLFVAGSSAAVALMACRDAIAGEGERIDDTPKDLKDMYGSAQVPWVAYATYDPIKGHEGVLPAGLAWLTAYGLVTISGSDAEAVSYGMPSAIHACWAKGARRGTFATGLSYVEVVTPGGADYVEAFTFEANELAFIGTVVRSEKWIQVLYGPTEMQVSEAADALIRLAGETMSHWPTKAGDYEDALPMLGELNGGTVITNRDVYSYPFGK